MKTHFSHFLKRNFDDALPSTSNLSLVFTSSKILSFSTLLHLYVDDSKASAQDIADRLNRHLSDLGVDENDLMLEYLVTSVISNLVASSCILRSLNTTICMLTEDGVANHVKATKQCTKVVLSISMWLSLIFHGAKFVIEKCSNGIRLGDHLKGLVNAIINLETSGIALLAVKSLIKAIGVISQVSMPNDFDYLESAFRSCLGGIQNATGLAKSCKVRSQSADSDATVAWDEGYFEYRTFLVRCVLVNYFTVRHLYFIFKPISRPSL